MDLFDAIQKLYTEKESLVRAISALEALQHDSQISQAVVRRSRRGRKSMAPEERQEVSERMRKYWASRRQAGKDEPSGAGG